MYDVIIVGGSFAGLAVAMQLRGHRVLVVDQHPIGSHQSSTCGTPLRLARMVGADSAIQQSHKVLIMHAAGHATRFPLPELYVTFDYEAFCRSMLERTEAEVRIARATGRSEEGISTTDGEIPGRLVVFASGWRALQSGLPELSGELRLARRGIETELPVRVDVEPGLHFYFERRIVDRGYAWVFPCGDRVRIGLVTSRPHMALRRRLDSFVFELGLEVGATHGGVIPVVRRSPIVGKDFVVGDAAGQCLPITDEGIRAAIVHGTARGRFIAQALRGEFSDAEARERYRAFVGRTPERAIAMFGGLAASTGMAGFALRRYLAGSGWETAA